MSGPRGTVIGMTSTSYAALVLWCTACGGDTAFEQPGCPDEHGVDCPEWACTRCGAAVLLGFSLPEAAPVRRPTSHVA